MKRRELVRHLEQHGCVLLREGANHSVFVNRTTRKSSAVPRHSELNDFLARKICHDLGIPVP
ncbi:MAG: type II toxin-antitoxin system HicA family toxin [Acidobacteria bacterium]|nr:type II toxin-antitoxin system HicA family toxin [Acidobacteriota bacterium]